MAFPADCPHRTDFHSLSPSPWRDANGEYRRILGVSSIWPTPLSRSLSLGAAPGHDAGVSTLGTFVTTRLMPATSPFIARAARSFLPSSSCRHEGRTVSSSLFVVIRSVTEPLTIREPHVQSLRILLAQFPADCPHRMDFHCSSRHYPRAM